MNYDYCIIITVLIHANMPEGESVQTLDLNAFSFFFSREDPLKEAYALWEQILFLKKAPYQMGDKHFQDMVISLEGISVPLKVVSHPCSLMKILAGHCRCLFIRPLPAFTFLTICTD